MFENTYPFNVVLNSEYHTKDEIDKASKEAFKVIHDTNDGYKYINNLVSYVADHSNSLSLDSITKLLSDLYNTGRNQVKDSIKTSISVLLQDPEFVVNNLQFFEKLEESKFDFRSFLESNIKDGDKYISNLVSYVIDHPNSLGLDSIAKLLSNLYNTGRDQVKDSIKKSISVLFQDPEFVANNLQFLEKLEKSKFDFKSFLEPNMTKLIKKHCQDLIKTCKDPKMFLLTPTENISQAIKAMEFIGKYDEEVLEMKGLLLKEIGRSLQKIPESDKQTRLGEFKENGIKIEITEKSSLKTKFSYGIQKLLEMEKKFSEEKRRLADIVKNVCKTKLLHKTQENLENEQSFKNAQRRAESKFNSFKKFKREIAKKPTEVVNQNKFSRRDNVPEIISASC